MSSEQDSIKWNDLNELDNYFFKKVDLITDTTTTVRVSRYDKTESAKLIQALGVYVGLPQSAIALTAGADGAIAELFLFFKNKGFTLLIPNNSYLGFILIADRLKCKYIMYDEDTIDRQLKQCDPDQSVLVVCSPNNPTGEVSPKFIEIASSYTGYKLIDEAYFEFCPELSLIGNIASDTRLLVVRTFSKAFAAAGIRLGYVIGHRSLMQDVFSVMDPYAVSVLSLHYGHQILLKSDVMRERVRELKKITSELIQQLGDLGWNCSFSQTHFFLLRCSGIHEMERVYSHFLSKGFRFSIYKDIFALRIMVDSYQSKEEILAVLKEFRTC